MPSLGWYADPQNPSGLRWFDGENWTEHIQPAVANPVDAVTAAQPIPAKVGSRYDARAFEDPSVNLGGDDDATGLLVGSGLAGAGFDDRYRASAAAARPGPSANGSGPKAGRSPGRIVLTIAVVTVLVAAVLTGGWWLFLRGSAPSFTYQGQAVSEPATVLAQAQSNLASIVSARHGATNGDTRCYFAQPVTPASGQNGTDVDPAVRCGPVLFVDGTSDKVYLSFPLSSTISGGTAHLVPASSSPSGDPAAAPAGFILRRPDGQTPPVGSGGLSAPAPPPGGANVLTATNAVVPASGSQLVTAIIGSVGGGVKITDIGQVRRYGSGDSARSAPDGQQLLAFSLSAAPGNNGQSVDLSASVTLAVDGAASRSLPVAPSGQDIVVAVPESTQSADLVLLDSGIAQTFSLLAGQLGPDNLQVLARTHRDDTINQSVSLTYNYSAVVVFADGVTAQTQTATVTLASATLTYRDDVTAVSASSPSAALLIPDVVYKGSHDGGPYGVDTSLLTFTPTGGTAIAAKNISTDPSKVRNVFEVPAGTTTGTLTVGGTAKESFSSGGGSYTLSVAAPMGIAVTFAAG